MFSVEGVVPTCELTAVQGIEPFPPSGRTGRDYGTLAALRMGHGEVFVEAGSDGAGIRYAPRPEPDERNPRHSIVAFARGEPDATSAEDEDAERTGAHELERSLRPMVSEWAITRVLERYDERAAETRDRMADVVGRRLAIRALDTVRRDTALCADGMTVARDVAAGLADHSLIIRHSNLVSRPRWDDDGERTPGTALREWLTRDADAVGRDLRDLNSTLHAQAALIGAHANLKLQPYVIALAILSLFAGLVAAVGPARQLLGLDQPTVAAAAADAPERAQAPTTLRVTRGTAPPNRSPTGPLGYNQAPAAR